MHPQRDTKEVSWREQRSALTFRGSTTVWNQWGGDETMFPHGWIFGYVYKVHALYFPLEFEQHVENRGVLGPPEFCKYFARIYFFSPLLGLRIEEYLSHVYTLTKIIAIQEPTSQSLTSPPTTPAHLPTTSLSQPPSSAQPSHPTSPNPTATSHVSVPQAQHSHRPSYPPKKPTAPPQPRCSQTTRSC